MRIPHHTVHPLFRTTARAAKRSPKRTGLLALSLTALLAVGVPTLTAPIAVAAVAPDPAPIDQVGFPVFKGDANPVPTPPAPFTAENQMQDIFDADAAAGAGSDTDHDFWIDKMLTRTGTAGDSDPGNTDGNQYLFSRGRAVFMKAHDPAVLGFGGQVAYWESIDDRSAYGITLQVGGANLTLTEDKTARKQTPSYWREKFKTNDSTITLVETKFITNNNVAVTEFTVTNTGSAAKTISIKATSPYATVVDGNELTGTTPVLNNLTTLYPRFSGDGLAPTAGSLTGSLSVPAGGQATTKVQLGFVAAEIPESRTEYDTVRAATPAAAYTASVTAYNKWWADNVPYLDVPDKNIEKSLFYRWWLLRFNSLDANIPGNDFPFPTTVEGALGYNNAIDLTVPLFIEDLKYFRDPAYSYGTWATAGEVQRVNGQYQDNPGDPANWGASHAQYISAAAWRSYEIHGGTNAMAAQLARYAEQDVNGQLAAMDTNKNGLLDTNWNAWTGNDADAVSFDYAPGHNLDRPETAFTWAGAEAGVAAYTLVGNTAKAAALQATADTMQTSLLANLWDPTTKSLLSKDITNGNLVPWKEINNYDPYAVGMMPTPDGSATNDSYVEALRYFGDKSEFPIFPFYTADQTDKTAAAAAGRPGSNNFSFINSTGMLNTFAAAIRHYPSQYVTADSFSKLLSWNAWANYQDSGDNRYPDATEFFANGSADPGSIDYRSWIHQTILGSSNHNVIEDVMGLQTRTDNKIELWPIDIGWDHFDGNNIAYRNSNLSITWDKPGDGKTYYPGVPEGFSIWVDGVRVATVDSLTHLVYDPTTGAVTFPDGGSAVVGTHVPASVAAANQVTFAGNSRVADIFAKTGTDVTAAGQSLTNVALGATATASFSASGQAASSVVDGSTAIRAFWGTKGSTNAKDSLVLTLPSAQKISDLKVFFYSDKKAAGYSEPGAFTVEYDDNGVYKPVTGQLRSPMYPVANYNDVRFAEVTTAKVRLTATHRNGYRTGVKEVQLFDPAGGVTGQSNAAPQVDAYADNTINQPGQVHLTGVVKDDGAPAGDLTQTWTMVSAPAGGIAVFDTPTAASTLVRFSVAGDYKLRLTASDGVLTTADDVLVTAAASAGGANVAPSATPTADYTSSWTTLAAVNDGAVANTSGAYWGTWNGNQPATRTLTYTWANPVRIAGSNIAFWYDSPVGTGGGVVVPKTWKIQYLSGANWVDVPNPSGYGNKQTGSNATTFDALTTTSVRAVFNADTNGSTYAAVGVSEWQIFADTPESVADTQVRTTVGVLPVLPSKIDVVFADGTRVKQPVTWQTVTADQVAAESDFTLAGIVASTGSPAVAKVWVRSALGNTIANLQPATVHTKPGVAPQLPAAVTATYNDGSQDSAIPVAWEAIPSSSYASPGSFSVSGTVAGTSFNAVATVTVGGTGAPDTTAPVLTASVATAPAAGWFTTVPVNVSGSAVDAVDTAPKVEFSINGTSWSVGTASAGGRVFGVSAEGNSTVYVRASDASGNTSAVQSFTVKVDTLAPITSATVTGEGPYAVSLPASDSGSGIAVTKYRIGTSGDWLVYADPLSVVKTGVEQIVQFQSTDLAGNTEGVKSVTLPGGTGMASSTTTLSIGDPDVHEGDSIVAVVTVTSAGVLGTDLVTISDEEGAIVGGGKLKSGKATLHVIGLSAGEHSLKATFVGNAAADPSTSAAVTVHIAFFDVPESSQFAADIAWLATSGVTTGYPDGSFRPNAPVDRQSMAAFLYRLKHDGAAAPKCSTKPFADVSVSFAFCGEIAWLKSSGISTGNADGSFKPASVVDRQAMAAFLYRLATGSSALPGCTVRPYGDVPVTSQFCGAISWLKTSEITTGYPDGGFHPAGAVDRGAMAAFLHRFVS